jgi:uncharacterized iron-regulated membrane protein
MPDAGRPPRSGHRTWGWLVAAVAIVFLLVMAFAMWSEREDAQRLPASDLERRGEEPWAPEPVDSPAVPRP